MGAIVQIMVLSTLSDQYGQYRVVAITEANMLASIGAGLAPICVGLLVLLGIGWRGVLFVPLVFVLLLVLFGFKSQVPQSHQTVRHIASSRLKLPPAFWLYWLALIMGVAAEWSVSFWGAGYLNSVVGIERTSASTLMSLFFLAAVIGRFIASRLTRYVAAEQLLLPVLGVAMGGFMLFWLGSVAWINILGLFIAGLGISNLFPLTVTATTNRIPRYSDLASARATFGAGLAMFFSPLILGRIADLIDLRRAFSIILILFVLVGIFALLASRAVKRAYIGSQSSELETIESELVEPLHIAGALDR
jgi:fucose permease